MNILVGMWHPAHVHTFRNVIKELEEKGHEIKVVAIDKDITLDLLNSYRIDYDVVGRSPKGILRKRIHYFTIIQRMIRIANKFNPDILISRTSMMVYPIRQLFDIPSILFKDDSVSLSNSKSSISYADFVFTPQDCNSSTRTNNHIKLPTFKELAYLHPNNFSPNIASLEDYKSKISNKIIIIRFVGWEAWHDQGRHGFDLENKKSLIDKLDEFGDVNITSEKELPEELQKYRLDIPPDKIHDFLYYADLFVGDSQTMTTEAAVLGTPAIRCNSFVGDDDMSNFIELEEKYGLIYNYREPKKAIQKAVELIQKPNLKEKWNEKRKKLIEDKIDLSAFLTWFIDNYPESVDKLEKNKDIIWEVGQ